MVQKIVSDFHALYPGRSRWVMLKAIFNPSFIAVALIRSSQFAKVMHIPFRWLLLMLFGIDVAYGVKIGGGLMLPHPVGIVLGHGVVAGEQLTVYQFVTLGSKNKAYPVIGAGVTIYPMSTVIGAIKIADRVTIGAMSFVDKNIATEGAVFHS